MIITWGYNMSKKDKLIKRLRRKPNDFTFIETQSLLQILGFELTNAGKTSGSRVKFVRDGISVYLHKPHQRKELLDYQISYILDFLEKEGLI